MQNQGSYAAFFFFEWSLVKWGKFWFWYYCNTCLWELCQEWWWHKQVPIIGNWCRGNDLQPWIETGPRQHGVDNFQQHGNHRAHRESPFIGNQGLTLNPCDRICCLSILKFLEPTNWLEILLLVQITISKYWNTFKQFKGKLALIINLFINW